MSRLSKPITIQIWGVLVPFCLGVIMVLISILTEFLPLSLAGLGMIISSSTSFYTYCIQEQKRKQG